MPWVLRENAYSAKCIKSYLYLTEKICTAAWGIKLTKKLNRDSKDMFAYYTLAEFAICNEIVINIVDACI